MAKPQKKKTIKKVSDDIHPDAQRRFERAVDAAVKSGPVHRTPKTKEK